MKLQRLLEQLPEQIEDLTEELEKLLKSEVPLTPDFVYLLARSTLEYTDWRAAAEKLSTPIETLQTAGAETLTIKLDDEIKSNDQDLQLVGLVEPTKNQIYKKYGLHRVVYTVENLDDVAVRLSSQGFGNIDRKKEGDQEVLSFVIDKVTIQVRTQSLATRILERNKPQSPHEQVSKLQAELAKYKELDEQLENERNAKLQIMADFQNFRQRMEKEKATFGLVANMQIVEELLDVLDDVKRTLGDEERDEDRLEQMLQILRDKLLATVGNVGVEQIDINVGDRFDSEIMEAIGTVPVTDVAEHNKVINVVQPAYKYKDKEQLLRTGKVIVGKKNTEKKGKVSKKQ